MTRTSRTDIHRPSQMDPADYRFVGQFDLHHEDGFCEIEEGIEETHEYFNGNAVNRTRCDHCGSGPLRYGVIFLHGPSGELVSVGLQCANVLGLSSITEKQIRAEGIAAARRAAVQTWVNAAPVNADVYEYLVAQGEAETTWREANDAANDEHEAAYSAWYLAGDGTPAPRARRLNVTAPSQFYLDLLHKLNRWGSLSEKQIAAVIKGRDRDAEIQAKRAAEAAALADTAPLVEGRREITGEVVSVKFVDNDFGGSEKMLVREADGNKVYGTVPASLYTSSDIFQTLPGTTITFKATIERSKDDEHFGFFKRPTGAKEVA